MRSVLTHTLVVAGLALALVMPAAAQGLTVAQSTDATSLDPAFRGDTATGNVQRHIFDTIMFRNADQSVVPHLAESVTQDSATEWTIVLRDGLTFSNGEPLDAEAVRFSVERLKNPDLKSPIRGWWTPIDTVEVIDPRTLKMTTGAPDPLFTARMTLLAPVPPKHVQEVGDAAFAQDPVGSGPYKLVRWARDEAVTLEANPDYWGEKPSVEQVTFRVVPEELSRVAALRTGEADIIVSVSPIQAMALENEPDVSVKRVASTRIAAIQFSSNVAPGDNQAFREAVAYAIDRDAIINGLLRGYAEPVHSILSPGVPGWPSDRDFTFKHDLEKARELVQSLNLGDTEIVLRSPSGRYPNDRETAVAVGAQLKSAGLNVTVRTDEWGRFFEDVRGRNMSAVYLTGQGNIWLDPYPQIEAFHKSDGFLSTWTDPEIDALLARSNEVTGVEREAVLTEALERLSSTVAAVPLYAHQVLYGVRDGIDWEPRSDEQVLVFEIGGAN